MDKVSKETRSKIMSAIRSQDTKAELALRRILWNSGYRYRKNVRKMLGKPDIVFRKYKIVVFVDSCFWHRCPRHFRKPQSNRRYWTPKIKRNKERDKKVNGWYTKNEWTVLRFWEHSIQSNAQNCAAKIGVAIRKRSKQSAAPSN